MIKAVLCFLMNSPLFEAVFSGGVLSFPLSSAKVIPSRQINTWRNHSDSATCSRLTTRTRHQMLLNLIRPRSVHYLRTLSRQCPSASPSIVSIKHSQIVIFANSMTHIGTHPAIRQLNLHTGPLLASNWRNRDRLNISPVITSTIDAITGEDKEVPTVPIPCVDGFPFHLNIPILSE